MRFNIHICCCYTRSGYAGRLCQVVVLKHLATHFNKDMHDPTDEMPMQSVRVCVGVCLSVPPRLQGAGSAIRCELGRIKNESAVMHY